MEKSNKGLGYHTARGMSRSPLQCVCVCVYPRCSLSGLQSSGEDGGSQSSFRIKMPMNTLTHTQSHTQSNEEFPFGDSPINQEMN